MKLRGEHSVATLHGHINLADFDEVIQKEDGLSLTVTSSYKSNPDIPTTDSDRSYLKIITFAMEAKYHARESYAATARLTFDLSTAQSLWRALGLREQDIVGRCFVNGQLSIFSSRWETVSGRSIHIFYFD